MNGIRRKALAFGVPLVAAIVTGPYYRIAGVFAPRTIPSPETEGHGAGAFSPHKMLISY